MTRSLDHQAEDLYRTFSKLIRRYQFRDREEIACHGVSVSQCYALSLLHQEGPSTMGQVAQALFLDLSTVTRLADQLEKKALIRRERSEQDRRICLLELTAEGNRLVQAIEHDLVEEYRGVLEGIPSANREAVIKAIEGLASAFHDRSRKENP